MSCNRAAAILAEELLARKKLGQEVIGKLTDRVLLVRPGRVDAVVKGLIELTPADMTIRSVTRVQPGTHLAMQQEYRRLLKAVLERVEAPRS